MPYTITSDCIGCTACARLCPVQAISGTSKEQHSVNMRRCVSCGVCGRACPKGAVLDGHGNPCAAVPRSQWKKPVIDASLCSACAMCVSVCPAEALSISPPAFHGDVHVFAVLREPKKCIGCALCEWECPLHAITMQEPEVTP